MKLLNTFLLLLLFTNTLKAQIPKLGSDTLVDVAQWNIEWFGDTQNGPTNESLQYQNVKQVISQTDIDIWSLCEVSDNTVFANLITDLKNYSSTIATYSQTQKTALIWKSSMFELLLSRHVLTETTYDYAFASRPPLEVMIRRTDSLNHDTLIIYVVHLKAYATQSDYQRRKDAAGYLKAFMDANRKNYNSMVMGDWNDELYFSTYSGSSTSPFQTWVNDTLNYRFVSKQLSYEGKYSYKSGSFHSMIDHISINKKLDSFYVKNSASTMQSLETLVPGYLNNTSDHLPIMGRFNFNRYKKPNTSVIEKNNISELKVFPNPTVDYIMLPEDTKSEIVVITNSLGQIVLQVKGDFIDVSKLSSGIYYGTISSINAGFKFIKQ